MTENTTPCGTEAQIVDLLTKVGIDAALIDRWRAFHRRSHTAYGAAEYADSEVDPYADSTRFGETPITVGQHNTLHMAVGELLHHMCEGLLNAVAMSEGLGVPLDALINLEDGTARFVHLLDTVDALDALVEAASASGIKDYVPEDWTA